jgi:TonB family protein
MKSLRQERESLHLPAGLSPSERNGLLKTGFFSLLLHMGLVVFLLLNLMSPYTRKGPIRFTVLSFSPSGDGRPPGSSGPGTRSPALPPAPEKPKQDQGAKKDETPKRGKPEREKAGKEPKKAEASVEERTVEGLRKSDKREKNRDTSLQEALEDIRMKAALDRIRRRVEQRPGTEKRVAEGPPPSSSQGPISSLPSAKGPSAGSPGSGTEKGTGPGRGTGTGTGTGSGGSPWGSSGLDSRLNDYYSLIWAKIKEGWTLPENLPKERVDLEAIIVLVIDKGGKLQRSWFEKKSGSALYDQMAMRAIKKAEPFPPIPKELGDDSLEIGIRFYPE